MVIRTGQLRIIKEAPNQYQIQLGQPSWEAGDSLMGSKTTFQAEDFSNINMGLWPPTSTDGAYTILAGTSTLGEDSFRVINPSFVKVELVERIGEQPYETPFFDVTYLDNTVETPTEKILKQNVTEYTWRPRPWWLLTSVIAPIVTGLGVVRFGKKG